MAEKKYIESEAAIELLKGERNYKGKFSFEEENGWFVGFQQGISFALSDIASLPAADVREVKRGRWSFGNIVFTDSDGVSRSGMWGYRCSECDGFCIGESNYCPNCGADMKEEQK